MNPGPDAVGHLEVSTPQGRMVVLLNADRITIGRSAGNGVALEFDPTASSVHAVVQAVGPGWCLRDLGSRNGTVVEGERLLGDRVLRNGDEIRIGQTRLVFRAGGAAAESRTTVPRRAPELTRRERDVLIALCRPLFDPDPFREPASLRDIAAELVVTDAAVKQHLLHLYDKFELDPSSGRRRLELANEAVRRGALTPADLRPRQA